MVRDAQTAQRDDAADARGSVVDYGCLATNGTVKAPIDWATIGFAACPV